MSKVFRHFHLAGATTATTRIEKFEGRDHLVIPVVALVEGVIWASNSPKPEFVPAEAFSKLSPGWNGEPVLTNHPEADGTKLSANDPRILEAMCFGRVFNVVGPEEAFKTKRLSMEAWCDLERAELLGGNAKSVIDRAMSGKPIEVSVGVFVIANEIEGEYNGKKYYAVWLEIVPDHLAMLPEGTTGACSVEMGCGAPRQAAAKRSAVHLVTASGIERQSDDKENVMDRTTRIAALLAEKHSGYTDADRARLEAMTETDFVAAESQAAERKTAAEKPASVPAAVPAVPAAAGATNDPTKTVDEPEKKRSLRERLAALLSFKSAETSNIDIERALYDALRAVEPGFYGVVMYYPDEGVCVYEVRPEDKWILYKRTYAMADGKITLGNDRQEVRPVTTFEPVAASAEPRTAACGCGGKDKQATASAADTAKERHMKEKADRIKALVENKKTPWTQADQKYLEGQTDERLTEIEAHAEELSKVPEAPAAAPAVAQPTAAAAQPPAAAAAPAAPEPKVLTEAEQIAALPKSVRDLVTRAAAAEEQSRVKLVRDLKELQAEYSEAELKAMPLDQLQRIARLAQANVPEVDYTLGAGVLRGAEENDDVTSNPPDGYALSLAAKKGKVS